MLKLADTSLILINPSPINVKELVLGHIKILKLYSREPRERVAVHSVLQLGSLKFIREILISKVQ